MRYLLDTNTLVYVLNERPEHGAVVARFDREDPEDLMVSSITYAELRYGVAKSRRRDANLKAMHGVLKAMNVATFDTRAAEAYGPLRAELEAAGRPIGPLDMLIAAQAVSLDVTLVTSNEREFSRLRRLRTENWLPRP
ncbi:MAG: type II toxin-antitoxin system tRNA(fMet)-specific endonuclease VapC [Betaproteobacteria bacterium]